MEKKFSCNFMLSLKEITLRRLTVILWTQTEILESIDVKNIHLKVEANTRKLGLPPTLTEQMKYLVRPIESEIRRWRYFHEEYLSCFCNNFQLLFFQQLCFTNFGTVDCRKMAEKLIRLELLDIVQCYTLACSYCLEDCIPHLWEQLPEKNKNHFYKEEGPRHGNLLKFQFCWPYILKGERTKLDEELRRLFGGSRTYNQYAFENSALHGKKAATEYFFRKLTQAEREASLLRTAEAVAARRMEKILSSAILEGIVDIPDENLSDTFCYLLSQMNPEMQTKVFKSQPGIVMLCFLDWPWQDVFLNAAEFVWTFLEAKDYYYILDRISWNVEHGYCSAGFFLSFFLQSPSYHKKHFVEQHYQFVSFIRYCFRVQDSKTIKLAFRNLDSEDRKRLVSCTSFLHLIYDEIFTCNWKLIELCLQEATLSIEDKRKLREAFDKFLTMYYGKSTNGKERMRYYFNNILIKAKGI